MKLRLLTATALLALCGAASAQAEEAAEILEAAGLKGGFVVHLGCGDGTLTAALRASDGFMVHGLDANPKSVETARETVNGAGLTGPVSVDRLQGKSLPYVDNSVNLVVAEKLGSVPRAEVMRALAPEGTVCVKRGGTWQTTVKPRPDNIDEWTHYMHDATGNAVSQDDVVAPLRHKQWVGSPRYGRHHDHMSSASAMVTTGGRLLYIIDEGSRQSILLPADWKLIARDAFNGTILWKRDIPEWHTQFWPLKSGPVQLARRLVALGDKVYVTLGLEAPLVELDAATGETLRTFEGTNRTEEIILSEGVLFLVVDERHEEPEPEYAAVADARKEANERAWSGKLRTVKAIKASTGDTLWTAQTPVAPLALASDGKRVYLHDGEKVVCLDRGTGDKLWSTEPVPVWSTIRTYFAPTLVVKDDVVLFAGGESFVPHRAGTDAMTAYSAETGEVLWTAEHPPSGYQSPEDLLVAGGLVWCGATTNGKDSGVHTGRDLKTGEVVKEFAPDVETYWFHHRCYRAKATENYLLMSRTGIEFLDIANSTWETHHWVRGACLYGVMPANGMMYTPPHPCACYLESKQYGMNVLAPASPSRAVPKVIPDKGRLEKGPAFGKPVQSAAADDEWPTYRRDNERTGRTATAVPAEVTEAWERAYGGRLTATVVGEGKLLVAEVDKHTLHALDADTGEELWSYQTGGRIDSPPTVHEGTALMGCRDGYVYCLRLSDGELIWRFCAAPVDRRCGAFEQLESVWPVHGNILVEDGAAYCVAGRSMFLDGGLRFLKLDPATGEKLTETVLDDKDPESGENLQTHVKGLNMTVAMPDILSSDGQNIYLHSLPFDKDGKRLRVAYTDVKEQRGDDAHLFSPTGFLDDTWWHRTYWVYGRSWASGAGGYYQAGRVTPAGRILVLGEDQIYGFGRKTKYYKWTTPLEHHLFAMSREIPEYKAPARPPGGSYIGVENTESLNPQGKPVTVEAWAKSDEPGGVVVARGGDAHGYSLYLKGGNPQFAVRIKNEMKVVGAKQNVAKKWVHLVGVLTDEKKLAVYVDGELAATADAGDFIAADPAQAMEVGADEGGAVGDYQSPFGMKGVVDEVRVYHKALTADDIRKHFQNPNQTPKQEEGLVLYFSFNDGEATDDSGNGNNGLLQDAHPVKGQVAGGMRTRGLKRRGMTGLPIQVKHDWSAEPPLLARGMVLAGDTLFIAGPPDLLDEEDAQKRLIDPEIIKALDEQDASLRGEKGALLWAVSTTDGTKLAEQALDSPPIFDGLIAAKGRLYMTTMDGRVVCMGGG